MPLDLPLVVPPAPEKPGAEPVEVLVVEDDEEDFFLTRALLRRAQRFTCTATWARSYEEGVEALLARPFDVALVDYRLGARDGLQLLREVVAAGVRTPIILLTGQGDAEIDVQAASSGASDYLVKGADAAALERAIRYARERRRAEEQIRYQADLLDKATDAILAFAPGGHVLYANRSTERLLGYPAGHLAGSTDVVFRFADPPLVEVLGALRAVGEWAGELKVVHKAGHSLTVESRWTLVRDGGGQPNSMLAILTDVTERKQLEAQFLRSQRMESIGRLVGGIAHDLGNLLVPVLLGVRVLQSRSDGDEKTARTLSMIQKSAQRGADMVKQVLAFARGVEGERMLLRVAPVVEEVEKIVRETFGGTFALTFRVAPDTAPVVGDVTQLQQVLMNLCVNARDAMEGGGALTVEAENIHLDERYARINLDARVGPHVRLAVTDTGSGIPADVVDKIFEPFYTTKSMEKGTGLGLSTVYSIVKSHGGFLTVYSEPGHGTTFNVYLPAAVGTVRDATGEDGPERRGEGQLVLVVDDEDYIRETARDILEDAGYAVATAPDGRAGLAAYGAHHDRLALVLTDVMMPEMDGIALIRAVRAGGDPLPILAASGMMGTKAEEVMAAGATAFLSKPFTADRLVEAVYEALHPAPTPAA